MGDVDLIRRRLAALALLPVVSPSCLLGVSLRRPSAERFVLLPITDRERTQAAVSEARTVFGPSGDGPLTHLLDALEATENVSADSVQQVRMDSWVNGRVVVLGDAAWCVSLFAGMGVSADLAGSNLLGDALELHPHDAPTALTKWEAALRQPIRSYQAIGLKQQHFFTPKSDRAVRSRAVVGRAFQTPGLRAILRQLQQNSPDAQAKERAVQLTKRGRSAEDH